MEHSGRPVEAGSGALAPVPGPGGLRPLPAGHDLRCFHRGIARRQWTGHMGVLNVRSTAVYYII